MGRQSLISIENPIGKMKLTSLSLFAIPHCLMWLFGGKETLKTSNNVKKYQFQT